MTNRNAIPKGTMIFSRDSQEYTDAVKLFNKHRDIAVDYVNELLFNRTRLDYRFLAKVKESVAKIFEIPNEGGRAYFAVACEDIQFDTINVVFSTLGTHIASNKKEELIIQTLTEIVAIIDKGMDILSKPQVTHEYLDDTITDEVDERALAA